MSFFNVKIGVVACILLVGCRQSNMDEIDGIAVIDVVNNLGKYQLIPVSRFVTGLEYIPLEIGDDCLIGEDIRNIIVTTSHIFVAGSNYCYAFDRDGRFTGRIGSTGQGPGEYQNIVGLSIDEKNQSLYIETPHTILEYSWDGVFRQSVNKPKNMIGSLLDNVSFVRDNLFIGHVPNYSGNEPYNFLLFDKFGQVIESFDNHVKTDRAKPRYMAAAENAMRPYSLSERIYVKENSNDTLYCLNEQNELIPQYVFDLGKYVFSNEKRNSTPNVGSFIEAQRVIEEIMSGLIEIPARFTPMVGAPHYIFFSIVAHGLPKNIPFPQKRVQPVHPPLSGFIRIEMPNTHRVVGIYDIVHKTTQLLDTDPVSHMQGFINDLDGGLSFWAKDYTSENELIDIWQAYEMKELLTDEYFAAHEIKDAQAHQKLKELLKILKDDDNPVIVIGKLK